MKAIIDTLWLIDGQYVVFKGRAHPIPSSFHSFTGYNQRSIANVRGRTCHAHHSVSVLIHYLGAYKESIGSNLARKGLNLMLYYLRLGLSNYANYLVKQCDAMKRVHSSQQPVSQI